MMIIAALAAGLAHFLIGGLWYSPLMFSNIWMRGLGLTDTDIREGRFNMGLALSASAAASFTQAAALVLLYAMFTVPPVIQSALIGAGAAFAFGFTPMLRDRIWANRPWPVILVDSGYECAGGAAAGAIIALMLGSRIA